MSLKPILIAAALLIVATTGTRAGCPSMTFGDVALNWVENHAQQSSENLVRHDLTNRWLNAYNHLLESSDELQSFDTQLQAIASDWTPIDRNVRDMDIDRLLKVYETYEQEYDAVIDVWRAYKAWREQFQLNKSKEQIAKLFDAKHLAHVGRTNVMEEFASIKGNVEYSFFERYTLRLNLTGNLDLKGLEGSVNYDNNAWWLALLQAIEAGYCRGSGDGGAGNEEQQSQCGIPIVSTIIGIFNFWEEQSCKKKFNDQKKTYFLAMDRLPGKLVTYRHVKQEFLSRKNGIHSLYSSFFLRFELAERTLQKKYSLMLRQANFRLKSINTILEEKKTELIDTELGVSASVEKIRKALFVGKLLSSYRSYFDSLNGLERKFLTSCDVVDYHHNKENMLDYGKYGMSVARAVRHSSVLGDFSRPLSGIEERIQNTVERSKIITPATAALLCSQLRIQTVQTEARRKARVLRAHRPTALASGRRSSFDYTLTTDCWVHAAGRVACGGVHLGSLYGDPTQPQESIFSHGQDGGYRQLERTATSVHVAIANVENRLEKIKTMESNLQNAIAESTDFHAAKMNELEKQIATSLDDLAPVVETELEAAEELGLNATGIGPTGDKIPLTPENFESFIDEVNGIDTVLDGIKKSEIVSSQNTLPGFDIAEGMYPKGAKPFDKETILEAARIDDQLVKGSKMHAIATQALDGVAQFSRMDNPTTVEFSSELLKDSRAIRQYATGKTKELRLTIVDEDGKISRQIIDGKTSRLQDTLIQRKIAFDEKQARVDHIRSSATTGGVNTTQKENYSRVAPYVDNFQSTSRKLFYEGDIIGGEVAAELALQLSSAAIGLIPVVGFAKDLQELVTGKDWITGETLNATDRLFAGFGVLTGGIGSKTKPIFKAMAKMLGRTKSRVKLGLPKSIGLHSKPALYKRIHEHVDEFLKVGIKLPGRNTLEHVIERHRFDTKHVDASTFYKDVDLSEVMITALRNPTKKGVTFDGQHFFIHKFDDIIGLDKSKGTTELAKYVVVKGSPFGKIDVPRRKSKISTWYPAGEEFVDNLLKNAKEIDP